MLLLLCLLLHFGRNQGSEIVEPEIIYTQTDVYERIYADYGTGADTDGSIWRAKNFRSDYCSLGDVAVASYEEPSVKSLLVSSNTGAVAPPASFSQVWSDEGSYGDMDVAIYKMIPADGFTCLGGVAVDSYWTQPDASKYCCVKTEFVTEGSLEFTWNDDGSWLSVDVSLYTIIRGRDVFGLNSGHFLPLNYYPESQPTDTVYQLKADGIKVRDAWSVVSVEKGLSVYQVSDVKHIWSNDGYWSGDAVSIWRAETMNGYVTLGDVGMRNSYEKPSVVFLVKAKVSSAVIPPTHYTKIFDDGWVIIYRVNCPAGYVSLGNVAVNGRDEPQLGDVYCVHHKYTVLGSTDDYKLIWDEGGDVIIYEAESNSRETQGVRGIYSIGASSGYPPAPYFLNMEEVSYFAEKPVDHIYISNIQFDLASEKQQTAPARMNPTIIENFSDMEQMVKRIISVETSTSSTWELGASIEIGTSFTVEAGVQGLGSVSGTQSVSVGMSASYGETTTETFSDSIEAEISLPGRSRITATVSATEYKSDIPFTANTRKVYFDGTEGYGSISGVYKGVAVSEATVTYGEIEYM